MARIFGAPVIEPQGKSARTMSRRRVPCSVRHARSTSSDAAGIGFDREQLLHLHRSRSSRRGQIVAQQIDDHEIFGAVLFARLQAAPSGAHRPPVRGPRGAVPFIGRELSRPCASAKNRSGDSDEDWRVPSITKAPWPARARAWQTVQRDRIARRSESAREGEIGLIDVARRDVRFGAGELGRIRSSLSANASGPA